jgi:flagellar M-ring protein FliF
MSESTESSRWQRTSGGARVALITGVAVLAVGIAAGAYWAFSTDYRTLFTQMTEADAATVVAELKRTKTPYRLRDGGTSIQVPSERVHETRLALVSSGAPLGGGIGFEIFDKQGLGATEQSQRVSYQRALQGELARTIGALEAVRQARVHLVMPESSLFKRDREEPRAAVSLMLESGRNLEREQVSGVQRLVAASIAGLDPQRVVVTDQRGVILSGGDAFDSRGSGSARLEMKRDAEEYVTQKIVALLERAYGPDQVLVSVDIALNFDETRRTVQDVLPVPGAPPEVQEAGVRRKRQIIAASAPDEAIMSASLSDQMPQSRPASSTDVEYEYGRRIEQVIAAPGGIEQMSVGVIVRGVLTPDKRDQVESLVRVAAGLSDLRGDSIVVQSLEGIAGLTPTVAHGVEATWGALDDGDGTAASAGPQATDVPAGASSATRSKHPTEGFGAAQASLASLPMVLGVLLLLGTLVWAWRRAKAGPASDVQPALQPVDREQLLGELRAALDAGPTVRPRS